LLLEGINKSEKLKNKYSIIRSNVFPGQYFVDLLLEDPMNLVIGISRIRHAGAEEAPRIDPQYWRFSRQLGVPRRGRRGSIAGTGRSCGE
jgi:hypothetical protein